MWIDQDDPLLWVSELNFLIFESLAPTPVDAGERARPPVTHFKMRQVAEPCVLRILNNSLTSTHHQLLLLTDSTRCLLKYGR